MSATVLARPVESLRTSTPPPQLSINTTQRGTPAPVPNKHLPFCSPGPNPASRGLDTPPASPPSPESLIETTSLTHPPNGYEKVYNDPPIYTITADKLAKGLDHLATQPLPSTKQVFPWLHGLHAENQLQLAFFIARKRSLRRTPRCLRGITVVKAGADLSHSRIKGAIGADEILRPLTVGKRQEEPEFQEADPKEGFSVRNFQIQACKMATVSDIVVYGDDKTPREEVVRLAKRIAKAQTAWQKKTEGGLTTTRLFNTFILSDNWTIVECDHPDLVQLDSEGCMTGKVMDFFHWERLEMCSMSAPSEIAPNVWLGPTPDPNLVCGENALCLTEQQRNFDVLVECSDVAQIPDSKSFKCLEAILEERDQGNAWTELSNQIEFPGSGAIMPPTWSQVEVDGLLAMCQWIHKQARTASAASKRRDSKLSLSPEVDSDGDSFMGSPRARKQTGRKVLIHCTDGYTESSLLALTYYMYANCVPVHDAWLQLHREKGRNFFAYSSDVHLLRAIQPRILQASPKHSGEIRELCPPVPDWLDKMDGSLPSRILPYMYLGNLGHANNPALLKELGIGQILSVGEPVNWPHDAANWPQENLMFIDKVQDNGVDPLTEEFSRCLEFIEQGRKKGTATLVHCRVGVSRSATICIAEVMNELGLSLPRA